MQQTIEISIEKIISQPMRIWAVEAVRIAEGLLSEQLEGVRRVLQEESQGTTTGASDSDATPGLQAPPDVPQGGADEQALDDAYQPSGEGPASGSRRAQVLTLMASDPGRSWTARRLAEAGGWENVRSLRVLLDELVAKQFLVKLYSRDGSRKVSFRLATGDAAPGAHV